MNCSGLDVQLGRRYRFAASHRLHRADLSDAENMKLYGKCNNPHGHGHNYVLETVWAGQVDPETGMIANLADLDAFVDREVLQIFDQVSMNEDVPEFANTVPTTENVCVDIFRRLQSFPGANLKRVRVEETSNNSFEYTGTDKMGEPESVHAVRGRAITVIKPTEEIQLQDDKDELKPEDKNTIAWHIREVMKLVGEDPNREGLRKTPERFEEAMKFLTSGYHQNVDEVLNGATFTVCYDEMVVVKDIEFFSLCEHHLLPFFGKAHVAYLPSKRVLGLSKIARLVNMFARRLQIQERMTSDLAKAIEDKIAPLGVGVIIEARHLCMQMRGVEKQHGQAVTSAMLGAFRENKQTRDEFLSLVRNNNPI